MKENIIKNVTEKTCYNCHLDKNKSEMQNIGVWVCNECLEKSKTPAKKQTVKSE